MKRCFRCLPVRLFGVLVLLFALILSFVATFAAEPTPVLLAGFSDELIIGTPLNNRIVSPTALAFLPDGRLLITSGQGTVHVWQEGANPSVVKLLDIKDKVCNNGERGMEGVALDPLFASNGYLYIYYTRKTATTCPTSSTDIPQLPINRLSRFTMQGNTIDPASELVLLDGISNHGGNHNSGALRFGPDGYLYVTVGDDSRPGQAHQDDDLRGKLLRLDPATGDAAPDNPHAADPQAIRCGDPANPRINQNMPCREIFARGLRNAFRFTFRPGTSEFYIHDVGQQTWEEISLGAMGADYGWDSFEGPCPKQGQELCNPSYPATTPGKTAPFFWYGHNAIDTRPELFHGCNAITGGAFVPSGIWPSTFDGAYLFSDYVCGRIWTLQPDSTGQQQASVFVDKLETNSAVDLLFGPTASGKQALYYTTLNGGGQIHRITYTGGANRSPNAMLTADQVAGGTPLVVTFDASGSNDPDGDSLTYLWDVGDGSPATETTLPTLTHTYTQQGVYTATLVVRDSQGARSSTPASLRIDVGNNAPVLTITTSTPRFAVGQQISVQGSAIDPEDGPLAGSALEWQVLLHHNEHTHPFVPATRGDSLTFVAPPPEDLDATERSYLEILLTATDSKGLSRTISQPFEPHKVSITFDTQPSGLKLTINGTPSTTPRTITSWEGYMLHVDVADQRNDIGQTLSFIGWADSVEGNRTITTPDAATTYTALFSSTPVPNVGTTIYLPVLQK